MSAIWEILACLLALMVLPGTLYLALLTAAGSRPPVYHKIWPMTGRLAIVVPAHNEESGIARTLHNLLKLAGADGASQVVVVADNCNDETAQIARGCGARVLVRRNEELRGKGYALHHAFSILQKEDFAAFVVVDADSKAAPDFISALRQHFARGALAVQTRYTVLNAGASAGTRLAELALLAFNVLRPRARHTLGLSAGILGNGFALRREVLERVPYTAASVVEDLEYHLQLIKAGIRVHFADDTAIRGDMPTAKRGTATQRARWEGGRLRMLWDHGPTMLADVFKGQFKMLEPLADLLLPPLAYHVLLLLLLCWVPLLAGKLLGMVGLLVVGLHVLAAARIGEISLKQLTYVLMRVPLYLVWKIQMVSASLRTARRGSAWVRTERNMNFKESK
jgi:cellulose synthase/poly-beta-1,6-N-acetylglucosamine synthase-like glycosyltransferase